MKEKLKKAFSEWLSEYVTKTIDDCAESYLEWRVEEYRRELQKSKKEIMGMILKNMRIVEDSDINRLNIIIDDI